MKRVPVVIIILTTFIFGSCEPSATFNKPQPAGEKSLISFPELVQGSYLAGDLASTVTITNKRILRHYNFDFKEHKVGLGSSYKLFADTLINLIDGTKEKILLKGDTIIQHANWKDTLFNISPDNVLKKFKGCYFLNIRYGDDAWELRQLSFKDGSLTIVIMSSNSDIGKLREITETTTDTTTTHFHLTRRQFKKFVSQGGFGEQERFTRIKGDFKLMPGTFLFEVIYPFF